VGWYLIDPCTPETAFLPVLDVALSFAGGIFYGSTSTKAGAQFSPNMMQRLLQQLAPYVHSQCKIISPSYVDPR